MHARAEVMPNRASKVGHFSSLGKTYYILQSTRRKCPPISGGFEANLDMETSSCTRYFQKSLFENVLPTEGGEHIFIKFAKNEEKSCQQASKIKLFEASYGDSKNEVQIMIERKTASNRKSAPDPHGNNIFFDF